MHDFDARLANLLADYDLDASRDDSLAAVGFDYEDMVELVMDLEEEFETSLDEDDFVDLRTVGELVRVAREKTGV